MQRNRLVVISLIIVLIVSAGFGVFYEIRNNSSGTYSSYSIVNLTGDIGQSYDPGSIQAFGLNNTSILISGVGYSNKSTGFSDASLMQLDTLQPGRIGTELSAVTKEYFNNGTLSGTAWNGTSWLLTGEAAWDGESQGGVIAMNGSTIDNLTSSIGRYFIDGGAWIDAWNGSGWLIGGNSSSTAVLIGYYHGTIINYTPELGPQPNHSWIQFLANNTTSWLVGGHGIFGFLTAGRYTNMLNKTAFLSSGVYAAQFTGGRWIIGGGPPALVQIISGNNVESAIFPPAFFNGRVNAICIYNNNYFVGGETKHSGSIFPALYGVTFSPSASFENLSSNLPSSFKGGQVRFMSTVTFGNYSGILIAGQGNYNPVTGFSTGALAFLNEKNSVSTAVGYYQTTALVRKPFLSPFISMNAIPGGSLPYKRLKSG